MPLVKHEEGARVHDKESPNSKKSGVRDALTQKVAIARSDLLLKPGSVSWISAGSPTLDELLGETCNGPSFDVINICITSVIAISVPTNIVVAFDISTASTINKTETKCPNS
ncbi:hypothetical protein E2562_010864 [Oryza meyeriana var. granulata]|uniref:Uncharacterized protein n=1 Tax=Oryza meyeriana var. granulata TaxID=110450 RepID=A0A6G1BIL4_9ORYZ|nr:hypothetical protein E2562_010864 [Oryza meyeriana var. granulata]